jgi:hypothetical protein
LIQKVVLGLLDYFTSVAFGESLRKSNLKTNGDLKKGFKQNEPNGSFLYQTVSK